MYPASTRSENRTQQFEDLHDSTNWATVSHDGWHLPGTFEQHDWCGKWAYRGCLNVNGHRHNETFAGKGYLKTFQRSCFRADCELCMPKWMGRSSNKATRRIEKYEELYHKKVKHIIISVPRYDYGLTKKAQSKKAYSVLKSLKCEGGAIIYHPFRYDRGLKEWYYSPHFHVLGFGWISGVAENYSKNGYFVKNLGFRNSTFSTFYYQLSHAGIKKHNQSLIWFGDASYSNVELKDLEDLSLKCPICEEKLHELVLIGDISHKPPDTDIEIPIDTDAFAIVRYDRTDEDDREEYNSRIEVQKQILEEYKPRIEIQKDIPIVNKKLKQLTIKSFR